MRLAPAARPGPSNRCGRLLGRVVEGRARLVPESEAAALRRAFQAKYDWLYEVLGLVWKLHGQAHTTFEFAAASALPEA
jgi:hypothetical protein